MQATQDVAESIDSRVRRRLRALRTERGLTLQQVAARADIDISTLSRLEAGKRRLALDHTPALAAALGVSADELLASSPPRDPRIRDEPRTHDGLTMWPLTRRGPAAGLHAYKFHTSVRNDVARRLCYRSMRGTTGCTSSTVLSGCCSATTT